MIDSRLAFEIAFGVASLVPSVFTELSNEYTAPIIMGLGCFSLASLTDRCFRKAFLEKLPIKQMSNSLGIGSAVMEELLYSVFLLHPNTFSNPWAAAAFTIARNLSALSVGVTAARSFCHHYQYTIESASGLTLDSKVGLIWMVLREGLIRTLPQRAYFPFLLLTNSVIFGLNESCPVKDALPNGEKIWQYKTCSGIAFRLIANVGAYFGGITVPLTQHIVFNISRYLEFKGSAQQA